MTKSRLWSILVSAVLVTAICGSATIALAGGPYTFGGSWEHSTWGVGANVRGYYMTYTSGSAPMCYISKVSAYFERHGRSYIYQCKLGAGELAPLYGWTRDSSQRWSGVISVSAPAIGGSTGWYSWTPARRNAPNYPNTFLYAGVQCAVKDYLGRAIGTWGPMWAVHQM